MSFYQLLLLTLCSCSFLSPTQKEESNKVSQLISKKSYRFKIQENSGEFLLDRNNTWIGKNLFVSKRILTTSEGNKVLEKSVSASKSGVLKNKVQIMRPEKSQYIVWFNKKKYSSITEVNSKEKKIIVKLKSPEKEWNGEKSYPFPSTSSAYCYFFQIVECVAKMGFIKKAHSLKSMVLDLYIVWEGFPYIQEQYVGIPNQVFTKATFSYDGLSPSGDFRFSLRFEEQMIVYVIRKNFSYYKKFWIAQGMSSTLINLK